jgi:hypothetical protein
VREIYIEVGSMKKVLLTTLVLMFLPILGNSQPNAEDTVRYRFTLPQRTWSIDFTLRDYESISEDGSRERYSFSAGPRHDKKSGIFIVHVRMKQAQGATDAIELRDWDRKNLGLNGLKILDRKGVPMLFGKAPDWPGGPGQSPSPSVYLFTAYWLKDQIAVELSGSFYGKRNDADENVFYSLVDAIKFIDTPPPTTSFDYYQLGKFEYLKKNFVKASEYFSTSLELERKERQLSKAETRDFVVQAADSFGAQRKIEDLRSTFEYGTSVDPTYHLFHWGLARYYAAKRDKVKALECLGRMYSNMAKADRKPKDILFTLGTVRTVPEEDALFKEFLKDPEFKRAIKEMRDR